MTSLFIVNLEAEKFVLMKEIDFKTDPNAFIGANFD